MWAVVIAQKLLTFYFVGTPLFFWHISASLTFHFAAAVPAPIFFPPSLSATISLHFPTHAQNCQTQEFLHPKFGASFDQISSTTNEILLPCPVVIEMVHPQSACHWYINMFPSSDSLMTHDHHQPHKSRTNLLATGPSTALTTFFGRYKGFKKENNRIINRQNRDDRKNTENQYTIDALV